MSPLKFDKDGEGKAPRTVTAAEALARLEALCIKSERCTYELRQKLFQWRVPQADAEAVMAKLVKARYVDDARFARCFVSDKTRFDRRGRLYLRRALAAKRIPRDIADEALAQIDPEVYADNLRYTLRYKHRTKPELADTFEGRTRLFRFAVSRGYESDLVSRELKALLSGRR